MRRLLLALLGVLLLAAAGGAAWVVTREERPLTAAEVAARATGAARVRVDSTIEISGTAMLRTVMSGVADLDRRAAQVRVNFGENHSFEQDAHDLVTTRETVYMRTTGNWVSFPAPAPDLASVAADPLLPLVSIGRATGWREASARLFRGRDEVLRGDLEVTVDGDGRPVDVVGVYEVPRGRNVVRLTLSDYGTGAAVSIPARARQVADIGAAFRAVGL